MVRKEQKFGQMQQYCDKNLTFYFKNRNERR